MFNLILKNKKNILSCFVSIMIISVFVVPFLVQATDPGGSGQPDPGGSGQPSGPIKIINPFKQDTIVGLINTIIDDILIPIGSVIAVMMIIYAGFLFVTARGDPGQIKKAKDALLWAVIGAAILLGAKVISDAISVTIGNLKK